MRIWLSRLVVAGAALLPAAALTFSGCDVNEGPAEKAGEELDEATGNDKDGEVDIDID